MKKIILIFILLNVLVLTGCNFLGDDQEETTINVDLSNYIKVSTIDDLKSMNYNKSYELDNDIDLNFEEWIPIGTYENPFRGNFRGNGYTIANLKITKNNFGYNGLFGNIEGNVEDLNIVNFEISFSTDFLTNAGGLAGFSSGKIDNVFVSGNININSTNSNLYLGLLVGNAQTKLENLVIAKEFRPNVISNNFASGNINISAEDITYAGGLIGKAYNLHFNNNVVDDFSLSITQTNSSTYIGGLIGHNFLYDIENIDKSLSVNKNLVNNNIVNGTFIIDNDSNLSLGGLIGYNQNVIIHNNFVTSDIEVNGGLSYIGFLIGENWVIDIAKNLAFNSNLTVSFENNYVATISGRLFESEISENYYYFDNNLSDIILQGASVEYANLLTDEFYLDNFDSLNNEFINLVKATIFDE
ncbi:MAG: hypothetical protein ACOCUD_01790 [Bacillota bacterium]